MDSPIGGCNAGREPTSGRTVGHCDDTVALTAGDLGLSRGAPALREEIGTRPRVPGRKCCPIGLQLISVCW
jgi:hypothetical protein